MAANKLYVTIDGEKREMNAVEKTQFESDQAAALLLETEYKAKQDARASALTKLGEIAGLTKEELDAIL